LKLPSGGEVHRCFYPFKLDAYGCGCSNDCLYCYAKSCLEFRSLWNPESPSVADVDKLEKIFSDALSNNKGKFKELIRERLPVRLGGMTDCFGDIEEFERSTYAIIKMLNHFNYPYLILTKNKLVAEYARFMKKHLAYIQFSITTPYDSVSKKFEGNASSTSERLEALKKVSEAGFYTAVRINPLFPMYPDGYFSQKKKFPTGARKFRYFDWSLVDRSIDAGANTIIAGFLRLSSWNIKWIKDKTGQDLTWLFDTSTKQKNQALHFSTEEKRYYYENIREVCWIKGADFSVCYDGDDDYEKFRYLWANQDDCCNGKGNIEGFAKTYDFFNKDFIKQG